MLHFKKACLFATPEKSSLDHKNSVYNEAL